MNRPPGDNQTPPLPSEVTSLRGAVTAAACQTPLPERFTALPHPQGPGYVITDRSSGREAYVPLFAYGSARQLLAALFPEAAGQNKPAPGTCPECGAHLEDGGPFDGREAATGVTDGHEGFGDTFICPAGHLYARIQGALVPSSRILTLTLTDISSGRPKADAQTNRPGPC